MRIFLSAFSELFIKLLGFSILGIPILFIINEFTNLNLSLKIGHSTGIAIPNNWTDLAGVETILLVLFLICLIIYKVTSKSKVNHDLTKDWPTKAVMHCNFEITNYSINGVTLKASLDSVAKNFGIPQQITDHKLIYPNIGLDILYTSETKIVAGFMIHFIAENGYKAAPFRAKLNDGSWQNLTNKDDQQMMRSLLGTPTDTKSLKDGFSETFVWENAKIQVFYTPSTQLRYLIFTSN